MNNHGNAYLEYFVLAAIVLLATLAFFNGGGFSQARASIESPFESSVNRILAP